MSVRSWSRLLIVTAMLASLMACSSDETGGTSVPDCQEDQDCDQGLCDDGQCREDVECLDDGHCEAGRCEAEECVQFDYGESCQVDTDCVSGICLATEEDGKRCTRPCQSDVDCSDDGTWTCQSDDEFGEICKPGPDLPPSDGSTLCGAGGVSEGEGVRLTHCLAPYDQASETLEGDGRHIESGGFKLITE